MGFGEKIQELRKRYNLTQKDFASKLSLTATNVGAWEKDLKKPSYEILVQIAKEFNVSLDWLCDLNMNLEIKTWADIINTFLTLEKSQLSFDVEIKDNAAMIKFSKYYVEGEFFKSEQLDRKLKPCYERPNHFYSYYGKSEEELDEEAAANEIQDEIDYPENPIYNFLRDWKKMYSLLKAGSIDNELFELWLNKQLDKCSYPIINDRYDENISSEGEPSCPQ